LKTCLEKTRLEKLALKKIALKNLPWKLRNPARPSIPGSVIFAALQPYHPDVSYLPHCGRIRRLMLTPRFLSGKAQRATALFFQRRDLS
jgi:hypothetical protein